MASTSASKLVIPLLTEKNYTTWLINVRALLRREKLWVYTQYTYEEYKKQNGDTAITQAEWDDHAEQAADVLTPTISPGQQDRLNEEHFNNGYLLLARVKELLRPAGDITFMRLTRELYSLELGPHETPSDFLTRIKLLEEQIDATKIELTADKRTLLALTMGLATDDRYRSLVQIWQSIPDMTAERARQMLLEEEQIQKSNAETAIRVNYTRKGKRTGSGNGKHCGHCNTDGHTEDECWVKNKHLAPEWLQMKWKEEEKKKNKEEPKKKSPWDVQ